MTEENVTYEEMRQMALHWAETPLTTQTTPSYSFTTPSNFSLPPVPRQFPPSSLPSSNHSPSFAFPSSSNPNSLLTQTSPKPISAETPTKTSIISLTDMSKSISTLHQNQEKLRDTLVNQVFPRLNVLIQKVTAIEEDIQTLKRNQEQIALQSPNAKRVKTSPEDSSSKVSYKVSEEKKISTDS